MTDPAASPSADTADLVPARLDRLSQASVDLDELIEAGADLETVLQRVAALFACVVGVRTTDGVVLAADPEGQVSWTEPLAGGHVRLLPDGTEVWLADAGNSAVLEQAGWPLASITPVDFLLRRLGVAVRTALLQRASAQRARTADLQTIVDPDASDEDRLPALRRLGLKGTSEVMLLAFAGPSAGVERVVAQLRSLAEPVYHTATGRIHFVLAGGLGELKELQVPVGVRGAFAPSRHALRAAEAWHEARIALRFALPSTHERGPYRQTEAILIDASSLGGYAILAEHLSAEALAGVADVQRIDLLYRENGGAVMLNTLLAVAATDSLRRAAKIVHLHHNSVAHRVERAEKVLGFRCTEPYGRTRLLLILTLHRLLESRKLF